MEGAGGPPRPMRTSPATAAAITAAHRRQPPRPTTPPLPPPTTATAATDPPSVAPVAPGRLNEWGAAAKARYRKRKAAVSSSSLILKPVQFTIASFYLMLFIWYRAYR